MESKAKLRSGTYALGALLGAGIIYFNYGTFDPTTGQVVFKLNLYEVIGMTVSGVGVPGMALLAVLRRWRT